MDFCFCLSGHIRIKHNINSVPTTFLPLQMSSHLETEPSPKRQGLGNFGDLALTSLFWWHKLSLISSFCDPQTLCVQYGVQPQLIFLGNKSNTQRLVPGDTVSQQGLAPLAPEGFSWPTNVETVLKIRVYLLKQKSFLMDLANILHYFIVQKNLCKHSHKLCFSPGCLYRQQNNSKWTQKWFL